MDENIFGDPYGTDELRRRVQTEEAKAKRAWERRFQKWSDKESQNGQTHYGCCGYGAICDYCTENYYGKPCVRALNEMLRTKHKSINYHTANFPNVFDGETDDN